MGTEIKIRESTKALVVFFAGIAIVGVCVISLNTTGMLMALGGALIGGVIMACGFAKFLRDYDEEGEKVKKPEIPPK